jgi:enoyl-CoA hydratase
VKLDSVGNAEIKLVGSVIDDGVATLTLNQPTRANAMDGDLALALLDTIRLTKVDRSVRAVVITGGGRAFSAGGDIATIRQMQMEPVFRGDVLRLHHELFWELIDYPLPTVAAINGPAVGAGLTIALRNDLVVMADDAFLSDPRVSLGLLDGAGGLIVWPLLTGLATAREHLLLGDRIDAQEAHRIGLANRVVPREEVLSDAQELARRLGALPVFAVQQARRLLNTQLAANARDLLGDCSAAEFACFDTAEHLRRLEELAARLRAREGKRSP